VIISDFKMPGLNRTEFLKKILYFVNKSAT
jgi:hypothetical protein